MDESQLWMKMPTEQMQEIAKKYKAKNSIEESVLKEQEIKRKKQEALNQNTWNGMKDTVPYLEQP